jgi:DNA-binding beta-propeller fold protein YncE
VAIEVTTEGEGSPREYRHDLVPRVVAATDAGAWFTAHHSTGLHFASLSDGKVTTPYVDQNGAYSEPRKQIEGVAATPDGRRVAITHEGRRALVVLDVDGAEVRKVSEAQLVDKPYWVTFDPSRETAFVSIPDRGLVEAYDAATARPLWRAEALGKAKRMAIAPSP